MENAGTSHFAWSEETRPGHLQAAPDPGEAPRRADSWISVALAVGVAALALVAWLSGALPAQRTLAGFPPAERAAVLQRAVANLRDVCRSSDRSREFCVDQARLALDQPECDAACRTAAQDVLAADTAIR